MSDNYRVTFTTLDRWHFHDGRPFHQNDAGMAIAGAVFPPYPHVPTAALRVLLAQALGWSGAGDWPDPVTEAIGSGVWDTGKLHVDRQGLMFDDIVFVPAPTCLERAHDTDPWHWPQNTTQGASALRSAQDLWLAPSQVSLSETGEVASGSEASGTLEAERHVRSRTHVGIALEKTRKHARTGLLYTMPFSALKEGGQLVMDVRHDPDDALKDAFDRLSASPLVCQFGGKGRAALAKVARRGSDTPRRSEQARRWLVHLVTPALWTGPDRPDFAPARLLRSWHPRPHRFAPWNRDRRMPWAYVLPAGATWEIEASGDQIDTMLARGLNHCEADPTPAQARACGFGLLHAIALTE